MKRLVYIISVVLLFAASSCVEDEAKDPGFEDVLNYTIYSYIEDSLGDNYSDFMRILKAGGIDKTLSAYNPEGLGYTLFLPDNNAIQNFVNSSSQFATLDELLANPNYAGAFARYHVVSTPIKSNDFPFGAFSDPTLSGDFLTVSFIIETDTSYYKINNQASVVKTNIETSNGFIHLVQNALNPVTFTTYQWLGLQPGVSIFKAAVDLTGQQELINFQASVEDNIQPVTLLVEPDSIFQKSGINSVEDLAAAISPGNSDYTNPTNPLYNFVAYHVLTGSWFLNDFEEVEDPTNYTTLSEIPLNIDGTGIDIAINKGKEVFDTIVIQGDTTFVDYVGIVYDQSNVLTQSGAVHFINQVLTQKSPSRATVTFGFYEEPLFSEFRMEVGTYLIDNPDALNRISWTGPELFFVEGGDQDNGAWDNDYLEINGDFTLTYQIPRIVQGKYMAKIRAERFSTQNAVVEVLIDGKKIGSAVDLTSGANANEPFQTIELGTIDFKRYSEHTIEIRPLIPGRFLWDFIQFEPM